MQRIGVTGHVNVSDDVAAWVVRALTERLSQERRRRVHGVTCLAQGPDQLFARVILDLNGTFEVVLPARDYPQRMVAAGNGAAFEELLGRATAVETMPFERSDRDAYLAASEVMLSRCDLLLAIWDGGPSRRLGDTAHVVARAHERSLPVEVIWPPEGERTGHRIASKA